MKMMTISIAHDANSMDVKTIVARPVIGFILRSAQMPTRQCLIGSQF